MGEGKPVAAAEFVTAHPAIEPLQPVGRNFLEPGRGLGDRHDPVLEEGKALAKAESICHWLADVEVDAPGPHPALRLLLRRGADQGRLWLGILQVLADRQNFTNI